MKTTADHCGHRRAALSTPFCAGPLPAVWAHPQSTYLDRPGLHHLDGLVYTTGHGFRLCLPLGIPPFTISLLGLEAKS